jgi:hypothetical protein
VQKAARNTPVRISITIPTVEKPKDVIWLLLVPTAFCNCFTNWLIWVSVRCIGPCTSQLWTWVIPDWTLLVTSPRLVLTCQPTNQPTRPMPTSPPMKVMAAASALGTPRRCSQATVGCSSALISRAAMNASATMCRTCTTWNRMYTPAPTTSSRQIVSAATRSVHGTASTGFTGSAG